MRAAGVGERGADGGIRVERKGKGERENDGEGRAFYDGRRS
jgi:hypothetical protein